MGMCSSKEAFCSPTSGVATRVSNLNISSSPLPKPWPDRLTFHEWGAASYCPDGATCVRLTAVKVKIQ